MNLPNKLTVSRLLLTLVFVGIAAVPREVQGERPYVWMVGYVCCVIAGFTDFFDGYIARKYDLVTDFGKLMDPLSDKIYTMTCFVVLTWHDIVPGWITILILGREFAVTGLRTLAARHGEVIAAKDIGKLKTVLQMLALAFGGCFWTEWLVKEKNPIIYGWVWHGILIGIVLLTVYSGWEYFWKSRHLYMKDV